MRAWLVLSLALMAVPAAADQPLLVILEETGQTRESFPVLRPHRDQARILPILSRGFPGRIVRLYQLEQEYLHKKGGPAPEPAYLLFSSQQGGFPRTGFFLGSEDKRHTAYVDLFQRQDLVGRFGAMDQIFPHELGHILLHLAAGEPKTCCANQVHAVGVRTDPMVAFDEGLAEHFQVMALDDPDADPSTHKLTTETQVLRQAEERLLEYRRDMTARFAPFTRWRLTFPFWFSQTEQVLRYTLVKRNAFAYEPDLPDRLLTGDLYAAYLVENVLPGTTDSRPKSATRMLSTESVVSALMYRWLQSDALTGHYREKGFYAQFGVTASDVTPVENAYLKLVHAMAARKPHNLAQLIAGYKETFPDEAAAVDAVVAQILLGQTIPNAPEIWLANPDFHTGSTVFDQFRSAPRIHTFDLNAASLVDLLGVPGVDRALAGAILKSAPYASLDDLSRAPGVNPQLLGGFRRMAAEMDKLRIDKDKMEESVPIRTILLSLLWRALAGIFLAAAIGAALYRWVRDIRLWRAVMNGLGAAFLSMAAGWSGNSVLLPLIVFAIPAVLWQLGRHRAWLPAVQVLLAWIAAVVPAITLIQRWW